jgi:DNA-binding transcriptional LysR family regulator
MAEIYSYKVFAAVVESGSFTKASQVLKITPSAVSHTISKLEKEMGFSLFIRNRSRLELTRQGSSLLPKIYDIINLEERIIQEKQEILGVEKGTVRIGAFNSVTMKWIPKIVSSFRKKYPGISIEVTQGRYSDVAEGIRTGMLDLGFVTSTTDMNSEIIPLYDDPLMCVTPKDFVPKYDTYVTVDEISKMNILMQAEGLASDTESFLEKHRIKLSSKIRVSDDSALVAMVSSGFGISIMPELLFEEEESTVNLYPISPPEFRTIGLISVKEQFISPATRRMKEEIIDFAEKYRQKNRAE